MEAQKINLEKVLIYVIMAVLGGGQSYTFFKTPEKIQQDTRQHSKVHFNENIDSLRAVIATEAFAQGVFQQGAMKYKQLEEAEAEKYLYNVFKLADKGLKNDSIWTHVQLPFIKWMLEHKSELEFLFKYDLLVPLREKENKTLHFNWLTGVRDMYEKNVSGGVLRGVIDPNGDKHPIQVLSTIKDH